MNNRASGKYRDYLHDLLVARKEKNARYSLRAFARDLDLAPSTLSEVLARRKNLSKDRRALIADRLHLEGQIRQDFILAN